MRLLITGSSGFLGSRLAHFYRDKYHLILPSHSQMNVSCEKAVMAYLEENQPDIVVHCAALSNTWYCEQHPEDSHKVNVQGTVKMAKASKRIGAKFIFMSSDQVYNGTSKLGPLSEWDELQPVNIYGKHKLEAEQRALMNYPQAVGLRLTWMYDLPSSPMKLNSNILVNLQKAIDQGTTIKAATHEYRGVTDVWQVVRNIEKTFDLPGGIYNFGSGNPLNSYSLHLQAANLMTHHDASAWILPDEEKFSEQTRNLTMNCSLINGFDIYFSDSLEGIEMALRHYALV